MLDVARHFQPIKLLKRTIDGMEKLKMNLLHLHLMDAASFPLLLDDDPISGYNLSQLARKSSFGAHKYYSKKQLISLVKYAKERRIEIIPEIEAPAHALSWGKVFQDVIVYCRNIADRSDHPKDVYPIDPTNEKTYQIITSILKQLFEIFPSKYIHIGGDEVNDQCWTNSTEIINWTYNHNMTVFDITKYFETKLFQIIYRFNKIPIVWQGVFDTSAIPDVDDTNLSPAPSSTPNPHGRKRLHTIQSSFSTTTATNKRGHNKLNHARKSRSAQHTVQGRLLLQSDFHNHSKHSSEPILYNYHLHHYENSVDPASSTTTFMDATDNSQNNNEETTIPTTYPTIIEPWKCWGGLAVRTAVRAAQTKHPVFMSACWYLDFRWDWTTYLAFNLMDSSQFELDSYRTNSPTIAPTQSPDYTNVPSQLPTTTISPSFSPSLLSDNNSSLLSALNPSRITLENYEEHENYFMGGEGAIWTEMVDHTNFECRVWPRYTSIAYRLWGFGSYFCDLLLTELTTLPNEYHQNYYYYFCDQYYSDENHINNIISITSAPTYYPTQRKYPFRNEKIDIPLNRITTKVLYGSYVNFKFYLQNALQINTANFVFHYPVDMLTPSTIPNSYLIKKSTLAYPMKLARNRNKNVQIDPLYTEKPNYYPFFPASVFDMMR